MSHHYERIYRRQEYMTPGSQETAEIFGGVMAPESGSLVVEVACGKGEAACTLAAKHSCRVLGFDRYRPFLRRAAEKVGARGLGGQVGIVRAHGARLPLRDATADGVCCIGAASIVGLDACLGELARVTRSGGTVVVSDAVWRVLPETPLGPEWLWIAQLDQVTADAYAARIEAAGLVVEQRHVHGREAWDEYFRPMLEVASEERAGGDRELAGEIERAVELEGRAADEYLDYVTFVARRA